MKYLRSIVLFIAISISLMGSAFAFNVDAVEETVQPETTAVEPRAEEVRWYYRTTEDGVKQRRLWSLTYGKWLTDWITVG